jgi:hypothetical protein
MGAFEFDLRAFEIDGGFKIMIFVLCKSHMEILVMVHEHFYEYGDALRIKLQLQFLFISPYKIQLEWRQPCTDSDNSSKSGPSGSLCVSPFAQIHI